MTKPEISGIAPFFIVKNVPAAMSFYRDRLGFDITFQGPSDDDIFFGIVQRGAAMIMLKEVGVDPVPNYMRDIKRGIARDLLERKEHGDEFAPAVQPLEHEVNDYADRVSRRSRYAQIA